MYVSNLWHYTEKIIKGRPPITKTNKYQDLIKKFKQESQISDVSFFYFVLLIEQRDVNNFPMSPSEVSLEGEPIVRTFF